MVKNPGTDNISRYGLNYVDYAVKMGRKITNVRQERMMDSIDLAPDFFSENYEESMQLFPLYIRNKINSCKRVLKIRSGSYVLEAWEDEGHENILISQRVGKGDLFVSHVLDSNIRYYDNSSYIPYEDALFHSIRDFVGFAAGETPATNAVETEY